MRLCNKITNNYEEIDMIYWPVMVLQNLIKFYVRPSCKFNLVLIVFMCYVLQFSDLWMIPMYRWARAGGGVQGDVKVWYRGAGESRHSFRFYLDFFFVLFFLFFYSYSFIFCNYYFPISRSLFSVRPVCSTGTGRVC